MYITRRKRKKRKKKKHTCTEAHFSIDFGESNIAISFGGNLRGAAFMNQVIFFEINSAEWGSQTGRK